MDGHRGHVHALDPSDGLGRRVGPRLEILLVGILGDTVQVLEVLGVLVSRDQVRPLVVQDALRHAAKQALRIWTRERGLELGDELRCVRDHAFCGKYLWYVLA